MRLLPALIVGSLSLSAIAANAATTSCSTVAACVMGTNSSSGIGVAGTSSKGFGVEGSTSVVATAPNTARAGVFGKDTTNSPYAPYNSGVAGTSNYGAGGSFSSVHSYGIYVTGSSIFVTQSAANPQSSGGVGSSIVGYGEVLSPDLARRRPGIRPAIGEDGEDVFQGYGCFITPDNEITNACGESSYINASGNAAFLNVTANSFIIGTGTGLESHSPKLASFAARSASPTIEDFGTATMTNGTANVILDKTFASTISPGYMVFVTPHSDSNSLYTQIRTNGFTVRESKGGRSTLTFDYRIIGKPIDAKATHLPALSSITQLPKSNSVPILSVPRR